MWSQRQLAKLKVGVPHLTASQYQMGLYEENFQRFAALFGDARLLSGNYQCQMDETPDLFLEVIEQSRFTSVLHLTHGFSNAVSGGTDIDPSAWIRIYHDSKQAEITHCYISRHLRKLFDSLEPHAQVIERRRQLNVLFNKWLGYLQQLSATPLSMQAIAVLPFDTRSRELDLELIAIG
jgi:uncharacterized protein